MTTETLFLLRYEWIITILIFLLLIIKLRDWDTNPKRFIMFMNAVLAINFLAGFLPLAEGTAFFNFYRTTDLIALEKNILNLGVLLISVGSSRWIEETKYRGEFYILMLSTLLGMQVMLSAGHMLVLYLGLELSTIPLAALANYNKNSLRSSEAGVKLIMSSAFATGTTLFGISLLYGAVGNLEFGSIISHLQPNPLTIMAFIFIMAGFAFKISAVPFHLWTADVYEGAPVAITAYLSVISKSSVMFVFVSILFGLFGTLQQSWVIAIATLSILSMVIGNLFAMRQQNIKRLLAFSAISQVGFMLVAITGFSPEAVESIIYFVIIYLLSNVAAFIVVGAVAHATGRETLTEYKGLYKSNPTQALVMGLSLLSLAGIPPTAGFFGKLFLLTSAVSAQMYVLLAIAALNLVLSLYNYLRVIKYMFIDSSEDEIPTIKSTYYEIAVYTVCVIGILAIGFIPAVYSYIQHIVSGM